jgi:Helix-turn-helix domain
LWEGGVRRPLARHGAAKHGAAERTCWTSPCAPTRRDAFVVSDLDAAVRDEPQSVTEIAEHFDITQQAVSLHLKVLREAGLGLLPGLTAGDQEAECADPRR